VITDGADHMKLVAFWRNNIPKDFRQLESAFNAIAATGGTERHSLVLEHAMRPMFSYLHAIVSPTGVYAATDDFGATQQGRAGLSERIHKAASDFTRLLRSCGPRNRRDGSAEELSEMERLPAAPTPSDDGSVED